jgi:Bacterial Ig domain
LWFTNAGNSIGRITTGGVVTNYTGTGISIPEGITVGPDGATWFTNSGNNSIGRITTGSNPPPSTSVLIPSNGAALSGSTTLDASASNATSVEFRLFGGIYGYNAPVLCTATPTIYGWLCSWNTTTVPNGSYVLLSEAFNSTGSTYSSGVNITVSNPPTTSVLIPSNGATQSGTAALLDASASTSVTSVKYELTGGTITDQVVATATPTYYGWLAQWNTTTVPNGTYTLQSVASYSGGSSASSSPVTITVNNPPPSTTVIIPSSGATMDTTKEVVWDAVASPGVIAVSFESTANGVTETQAATPTIYGWIAIISTGGPPCSGCIGFSFPISIQSVASYSDGVTGTSPVVNATLVLYLPPSII